ncbi:MAG: hypothetical protein A2651_00070 [Candidatus Yanofskybacteria bacterium RIFCSPHIGHO2_01_FULL_42_12]|uniref:Uncharacterized protein n=1 Tax=Candidatus Yanofskybacteria bacterium RIFCSPLOWO2_01_FULL_42_49 TaxID=1802694 RepID=A0A1F8GC97_9BACT|nr:MAG: hypothetical protein A2651_00070 [Candidatus Yanofskybacteria bacterium RIFCSPHIGHO2_01_FULL_42_12]OGN23005.1 MAG: hypothetical protein A2918_02640 [Candidatus Yanofskybacteria bacterium RIFCSPLOWO2_01_FULL_42_49]
MKTALLALIFFCFCPYLARGEPARADTPSVPDISGWIVVSVSRIEIRLSDDAVAYLGLDVKYQNPANLREFVRVISRHLPLVLSKKYPKNQRLFREVAAASSAQKEERDRLNELSAKTDPFLYVQWRIQKDARTEKDAQGRDVSIWFRPFDGNWLPVIKNEKVKIEFLSENVGNGKTHNILVGRKYQVGGSYHILKLDRFDLVRLASEEDR